MYTGKYVVFSVVWLYLIALCALLLFSKGFLLKRVVVNNISECGANHWLVKNLWNGVTSNIRLDLHREVSSGNRCNNLIKPRFKKAVLVIIDGLRYDFLTYNEDVDLPKVLPFQNKMRKLHSLLKVQPKNGKLFKFEADPPTTTMQRIKGITTGSLPTFIDAGTNFNSYEITEDNILSQALKQGKNISFMGCSTWTELYPTHFQRKIPFSALNVKDLDTIDYGIMKHLIPEVKRDDWSLLIAHFLGVDHCGHRYGTHHPEMTRKLTEMDGVITGLAEAVDEETIVFVMGDHGMTRSGDHGGDSKDEVMAGLFVYAKKGLFQPPENLLLLPQVSQIDMVPTLSLLLDQPIPFSNLGTIIPDFFQGPPDSAIYVPAFLQNSSKGWKEKEILISRLFQQINAAYSSYLNCKQLFRFIDEYQKVSKDLPATKMDIARANFEFSEEKFQEYLDEIVSFEWHNSSALKSTEMEESIEELNNIHKSLQELLETLKDTCRGIWAKFDIVSITMGFTLMTFVACMTLISTFLTKKSQSTENNSKFVVVIYIIGIALCGVGIALSAVQFSEDADTDSLIVFIAVSFSFSLWLLSTNGVPSLSALWSMFRFFINLSILTREWFLPVALLLGQCLSLFSNSYIIHEDSVTLFISQTLILYSFSHYALRGLREIKLNEGDKSILKKSKPFTLFKTRFTQCLFNRNNQKLCAGYVASLVCLRVTKSFWFCREMQLKCSLSPYALPLVSLLSEFTEGHVSERLIVALIGILFIVYVTTYRLKKDGNLNGANPIVYIVRLITVIMAMLIMIHWFLQLMLARNISELFDVQSLQQIVLPRLVYILFVISLVALIRNPLAVYKAVRREHTTGGGSVVEIYQFMRRQLNTQLSKDKETPVVVYGLKTAYSSSIVTLLYLLIVVACMVMTDGMVLPLACLWLTGFFVCRQFSIKPMNHFTPDKIFVSLVVWIYFMWCGFFGSGHQTTIPAIRFHAAYIGFIGSIPEIIPQVLVILLNTFAAQIICCIGLPLLILFQPQAFQTQSMTSKKQENNEDDNGEVEILENKERSWFDLYRIVVIFVALLILKVSFASVSAAVHRRHLMVWKIFAPRFMFEAVSFLLSVPMICLGLLFYARLDSKLRVWVSELKVD